MIPMTIKTTITTTTITIIVVVVFFRLCASLSMYRSFSMVVVVFVTTGRLTYGEVVSYDSVYSSAIFADVRVGWRL
jgi:hypothetical protein